MGDFLSYRDNLLLQVHYNSIEHVSCFNPINFYDLTYVSIMLKLLDKMFRTREESNRKNYIERSTY